MDSDSDAPEEFTAQQGIQLDEEIRRVQTENKTRVAREGKERRRKWAQKLTPRSLPKEENPKNEIESETPEESQDNKGMLPDDIVKLLAAGEKKVFTSDSEDEKDEKKPASKKRRSKISGLESYGMDQPEEVFASSLKPRTGSASGFGKAWTSKNENSLICWEALMTMIWALKQLEAVVLKDIPPPQCVQNSLDFLKKRKMQVSRSSAVLNNSNQALRLLYKSGLLK
ncbi:hypothetical protein OROGR_018205 [Orobanche gracilis]